jgi:hypothetical protein
MQNRSYDLAMITGTVADGGVVHGRLLVAFAEAVLGPDDRTLAQTRDALTGRWVRPH